MRCQNCGSRDIDFQESGGQSVCVNCGTVLEENTLTASIEFQVIRQPYEPTVQYLKIFSNRSLVTVLMLLDNLYLQIAVKFVLYMILLYDWSKLCMSF